MRTDVAPLTGVHILDCLTSVVGPLRPERWRDQGALVSRVRLTVGQASSQTRMPVLDYEDPLVFDMSCDAARASFYELVRNSDALVHNYRRGTASHLGVDREALKAVNPNLVYLTAYRR
ncbi:CoA transferase [Sphingomonas sp. 1P08PE]|uniref:CoA transferase n=1 Tax=Sphingomonas sp. 1P08PE TaxID=554122 RepID=UPI0039A3BEF7